MYQRTADALRQAARALLLILSALSLEGCVSSIPRDEPPAAGEQIAAVFEAPGSEPSVLTENQLQDMLMDFADIYVAEISQGLDEIRRRHPPGPARTLASILKVMYSSAAVNIAAGRKPAGNLLDMIVHVNLARHALETHFAPEVFGPSADHLRAIYIRLEAQAWRMSSRVLTQTQQTQLLGLIDKWIQANPDQHYVAEVRLTDFVALAGDDPSSAVEEATGLLAEVERAFGVADQALMTSERAMYIVQRLPRTLMMQSDLTIDQVTSTPELQQMLTDTNRFVTVSERLADAAEQIPQHLLAIRQTSQQMFSDVQTEGTELQSLVLNVQAALDTSTLLTDKVNTTIQALTPLLEGTEGSSTDIDDYLEALDRSILLAERVNHVLAQAAPILGPDGEPVNLEAVSELLDVMNQHSASLMTRAFVIGSGLIGIFLVGLLIVLLVYRFVSARMARPV